MPCIASLIKRKWNSQHVPPCGKGIYIRWQHLIFFYLCTWFSCTKKIGQSCIFWAVGPALQSNSFNCLVLILHRQLGNFHMAFLIHCWTQNSHYWPKSCSISTNRWINKKTTWLFTCLPKQNNMLGQGEIEV